MHIGVEATNLRSQQLGGVWRYTECLIQALGRVSSAHRYSLLFFDAFKPWARVSTPSAPSPAMRLVEVTSFPNFVFTFFASMIPTAWGGPWIRRMLFRLSIGRVARLADAVIVPSSATARDFASRFPSATQKIRAVPLAPREQFVVLSHAERMPVIDRYGLTHRDYVLFAGNIEPRKNLLALIDAYNRMRQDMRTAPCLAIAGGAGWKNQAIHQAAAASPYAADIRFLGYVADADLPALMGGALAFVYPAIYEGFGLPPLEAMACGTPVITSNRSSLPEVVGDAALLVDPNDRAHLADAMARVVEQEPLRKDLRERGLKRAERFTWEETARLTLRVYEGSRARP
jgi:glycosyltransferase involved in cell wall biosynthesis